MNDEEDSRLIDGWVFHENDLVWTNDTNGYNTIHVTRDGMFVAGGLDHKVPIPRTTLSAAARDVRTIERQVEVTRIKTPPKTLFGGQVHVTKEGAFHFVDGPNRRFSTIEELIRYSFETWRVEVHGFGLVLVCHTPIASFRISQYDHVQWTTSMTIKGKPTGSIRFHTQVIHAHKECKDRLEDLLKEMRGET